MIKRLWDWQWFWFRSATLPDNGAVESIVLTITPASAFRTYLLSSEHQISEVLAFSSSQEYYMLTSCNLNRPRTL